MTIAHLSLRLSWAINEVKSLETYQRSLLRQLQSLPDRCENIPVYTLLGAKPLEIVLDNKALSFFGNMVRQKESLEHRIICRKLAVKDENSSSFTITLQNHKIHNLQDAYELINNMPSKQKWRSMVTEATNNWYYKEMTEDAEQNVTGDPRNPTEPFRWTTSYIQTRWLQPPWRGKSSNKSKTAHRNLHSAGK